MGLKRTRILIRKGCKHDNRRPTAEARQFAGDIDAGGVRKVVIDEDQVVRVCESQSDTGTGIFAVVAWNPSSLSSVGNVSRTPGEFPTTRMVRVMGFPSTRRNSALTGYNV